MISRKRGAIINHFAVYAETKAFVLSFTEAHAEEVKATGVRLLGLCSGSVNAEKCSLTTRGVLGKLPSLTAERVLTMGLKTLENGRVITIVVGLNRFLPFMGRLIPRRTIRWLMGKRVQPPRLHSAEGAGS